MLIYFYHRVLSSKNRGNSFPTRTLLHISTKRCSVRSARTIMRWMRWPLEYLKLTKYSKVIVTDLTFLCDFPSDLYCYKFSYTPYLQLLSKSLNTVLLVDKNRPSILFIYIWDNIPVPLVLWLGNKTFGFWNHTMSDILKSSRLIVV
jgi:hypothetical protein